MHRPSARHRSTFIHAEALAGGPLAGPHGSLPSLASWQRAIEHEDRAAREANTRAEPELAEEEIAFAAIAPRDLTTEATVSPLAEVPPLDWRRSGAPEGRAH
jgi:hypothetical protein